MLSLPPTCRGLWLSPGMSVHSGTATFLESEVCFPLVLCCYFLDFPLSSRPLIQWPLASSSPLSIDHQPLLSFMENTEIWIIIFLPTPVPTVILGYFSTHKGMCVCVHAKSLQSCQTLCDPMDCSPPASSVHGILQARMLEWVAMPFSRGAFWPRDWTYIAYVSCIGRRVLYQQHQLGRPSTKAYLTL